MYNPVLNPVASVMPAFQVGTPYKGIETMRQKQSSKKAGDWYSSKLLFPDPQEIGEMQAVYLKRADELPETKIMINAEKTRAMSKSIQEQMFKDSNNYQASNEKLLNDFLKSKMDDVLERKREELDLALTPEERNRRLQEMMYDVYPINPEITRDAIRDVLSSPQPDRTIKGQIIAKIRQKEQRSELTSQQILEMARENVPLSMQSVGIGSSLVYEDFNGNFMDDLSASPPAQVSSERSFINEAIRRRTEEVPTGFSPEEMERARRITAARTEAEELGVAEGQAPNVSRMTTPTKPAVVFPNFQIGNINISASQFYKRVFTGGKLADNNEVKRHVSRLVTDKEYTSLEAAREGLRQAAEGFASKVPRSVVIPPTPPTGGAARRR